MFSFVTFAQSSNQPLKFRDIPIRGTLNEFVEELDKNGYTVKNKTDSAAFLIGNFACYRRCDITILSSKTNDWVKQVGVCLPVSKRWEVLLNNYAVLKNTLASSYGYSTEEREEFLTKDVPEDDKGKINLLKDGKCIYETIFRAQDGNITLTITRNCNVLLMFTSDFY